MKRTHTTGNGNPDLVPLTAPFLEENSYLQRSKDIKDGDSSQQEIEGDDEATEDEFGAPVDSEDERRSARRRRRKIVLVGTAILLLMILLLAVFLYRREPTKVEYGERQTKNLPPVPSTNTTQTRDSRTDKAIEEAQRLTGPPQKENPNADVKPETNSPFKVPDESEISGTGLTYQPSPQTNTSRSTSPGSESPSTIQDRGREPEPRVTRSQRSQETSLYMSEPPAEGTARPSASIKLSPDSSLPIIERPGRAQVPGFGSMLPVRTLGGLYTLRTGALVRLELTRETSGEGWSMKRGTVLIGTTKGSDLDRAYISLVGFIDQQSGKLVKLEGELLGGDGTVGLKGKQRQLDGGWMRALGRVAGSGLEVAGAFLNGRGRETVVISDGLRTRTINPVTDELSGVLGNELDRSQRRSFVEVGAGTSGYVLITDLPTVTGRQEAQPEVDSGTLASLTDVNATRPATGLSEKELADLLANGSPEEIRVAMPRMSAEMRRIAEAVLKLH